MKLIAHALGNVFLGIALGLAAYYLLTDLVTTQSQVALRRQLDLGTLSSVEPTSDAALMEWEGWQEQDVAYWTSLAQGGPFGRIIAASIGLDAVVVKGARRQDLTRGPGWLQYTDVPGPTGNAGIAGHRTTYGAPFRSLHLLSLGDTIDLYSPYRRYRYVVSGSERVTPNRVDVMDTTASPQLTLSACDPPYS
ncbi:MAG: class E sortase, partial [Coriobacteriia bacterium]|nr:class E sortase [Coriobacteriia bacterium]